MNLSFCLKCERMHRQLKLFLKDDFRFAIEIMKPIEATQVPVVIPWLPEGVAFAAVMGWMRCCFNFEIVSLIICR